MFATTTTTPSLDVHKFLRLSSEPIVVSSEKGDILHFNKSFLHFSRYTKAELYSLNIHKILPPKKGKPTPELVTAKIDQDEIYEFYATFYPANADIEDVFVSCTISMIEDQDVRINFIRRPFHSDKHKDERYFLNQFPEENPNPVLQVNAAMRIIYANRSSNELLENLEVGEGDLLPGNWQNHIQRLLDDDVDISNFEYQIGGKIYQFEHSFVRSTDLIFIHGLDISDLKQTQQKLEELNCEMNNFLYRAHHDLKSPVSTLRGLMTLALDKNKDVELDQFLRLMESTTQKMDDILGDLVKVIRLNKMKTEPGNVDPNMLLQKLETDKEIAPFTNSPELEIVIDNSVATRSDVQSTFFILKSLVSNALKFRDVKKIDHRVKLWISTDGDELSFTVQDNGMGISPAIKENIFDMFFRGTNEVKGNGMGLYIAKKSADVMRGKINFETKEGQGTTFHFSAPSYY